MPLDKQSLLKRIYRSFPSDIPVPSLHIYEAEAIDWYLYKTDPEKFQEIRSKKYDFPWPEVPRKHLTDNQHSLSYLEPEGILYYIPRVMVDFIENFQHSIPEHNLGGPEMWLHESLIYGFEKSESFELFNEGQRETITEFILYVSTLTDYFSEIKKYLENEWAPKGGI